MKFIMMLFTVAMFAACSKQLMNVLSPDGEHSIRIDERFGIDSPAQSIILNDTVNMTSVTITNLKNSSDWVDDVRWSAESKLAGVLVSSSVILVIDAEKQGIVHIFNFDKGTNYPPSAYISEFGFTGDNALFYDIKIETNTVRLQINLNK